MTICLGNYLAGSYVDPEIITVSEYPRESLNGVHLREQLLLLSLQGPRPEPHEHIHYTPTGYGFVQ